MSILRFLVLLAAVALVGCNTGSAPVSVDAPEATSSSAKTALEAIAESGEIGSEIMGIREALEGSPLLAELDELEAMTDADAIKAKAKEMADKL